MLFNLWFCAACVVGINVGNIVWALRLKAGGKVIALEVVITLICLGLFITQINIYMSIS